VTELARRLGATISAICLGLAGAVLLFAPVEAGNVLMPGSSRPVLMQLLGGALVGYGIANWTARGSALGGIYGRAVVAGNQAHFMIGALLLLTQRDVGAAHPAYWGLVLFYVIGAAFFSYLMFFSSGLKGR
jgi:hypothetical protein